MTRKAAFSAFIFMLSCPMVHGYIMGRLTRTSKSLLYTKNQHQQQKLQTVDLYMSGEEEEQQDVVLFSSDWEDGVPPPSETEQQSVSWKKNARWESLHPRVKLKIIEEGQQKAILNKKKREPLQAKKRRMLTFYKNSQKRKKLASKVKRPLPFYSRMPLSDLAPGMQLNGTVISLTNFGAYVDVGSECDGLLHVSQITRDQFVEHPRQLLSPGDAINVTVYRVSPDFKKLQLTMLSTNFVQQQRDEEEDDEDRIPLEDIEIDDELWGEINRVTDYGAYVELGAEVEGFLHFMDHPHFGLGTGAHPTEFMSVGQRVRVWASDVDMDKRRIKLTANRPKTLPRLKREIMM